LYLHRRSATLGLLGQSQLFALPDGADGVRATLYLMRALVKKYKMNPDIRHVAASLVAGELQKDWVAEIKALHAFVRDEIRYVRDIEGVETVQTPDKTLEFGYGDCDDKALLLATLLQSIGHKPVRFVAVGTGAPGHFSHVFVDTLVGTRWIPLETTEPVPAGWASPKITTEMIVKV
jgi:transglutaminase-like putative cysteine protease